MDFFLIGYCCLIGAAVCVLIALFLAIYVELFSYQPFEWDAKGQRILYTSEFFKSFFASDKNLKSYKPIQIINKRSLQPRIKVIYKNGKKDVVTLIPRDTKYDILGRYNSYHIKFSLVSGNHLVNPSDIKSWRPLFSWAYYVETYLY